ncbi:helix-turn-helix domain-containing protein [Arcanobacterium haemolyticum]|nr:helix-turn-helix domain-containing protein [Arcanobacterium haemolyticum]
MVCMDVQGDIREFLSSRRARISPEEVGFPSGGGRRRVPGLRREEVAMLAGVSVDYYIRIERGNLAGVSEDVLTSIARALRLTEAEQTYFFDLARQNRQRKTLAANVRTGRSESTDVPVSIRAILDAVTETPAWLRNHRFDIMATNPLAHALYQPMFDSPRQPANIARFIFLEPCARTFYPQWERIADDTVALLRVEAAHHPGDKAMADLIGELATQSDEFSTRWAMHNVLLDCRPGTKHVNHPVVGELTLAFETMTFVSHPDLALVVYSAEPGSYSADGLKLLASWEATKESSTLSSE